MISKPRAIIIGAGFGGLATANLLAKTGWQVEVYESRSQLGGKVGIIKADGFVFDAGPSWYLMPEVYEHYFSLLGETVNDYLTLKRLDPSYTVFYDYATQLTIPSGQTQAEQLFTTVEPGSGKALQRYLASAELTYSLAKKYFLFNPFTRKVTLVHPEVLRHSLRLVNLLTKSMHRFISRYVDDLRLQQILEYPAVFLGSSPFKAPAMYHLMSHLDITQGVYYPLGGIYELIKAMQKIGTKLGVSYHLNSPVAEILVNGAKATGIRLQNGEIVTADIIISNADLHFTETALLPKAAQTYPEKYWQQKTSGPSALLMYLGVKGSLPELDHHNLLFVKDWQQNFTDIYDTKQWPAEPSIYICKPSATDKTVAPEGSENVFVLVPLPAGIYKDAKQTKAYADACLQLIAKHCGINDLAKRITFKKLYGPGDFDDDLGTWQGSALGLGHTLFQSAFFRPAGKSKKLQNLYYVGGDTQPGVGLPMCLISAELVYKRLTNDHSAGPLSALRIPKGGWRV